MFYRSIKALAGCKWSALWCFRERFGITGMVWPCCNQLLIYWKSFCFLLHLQSPGTSSFRDSLIKIPKRKRQRCNMSEWVSNRQRCWTEEKVWLIQGVWNMSGITDFYCFRAQSEVLWGGPNLAVPLPAHITSEKHSLTLKLLLHTLSNRLIALVRK